jgi:hypothetical protein
MHDIPRPSIVLNPPDKSLRATLDLADALLACDDTPWELNRRLNNPVRVKHDLDLAQPAHQFVFDATHECLRASARASESLAHPTQGEAELSRIARLVVWYGRNSGGERRGTREIRWEWDGECSVLDR